MARIAVATLATLAFGASLAVPQSDTTPARLAKDEVVVLKFPSKLIETRTRKQLGMYAGEDDVVNIAPDSSGRAVVGGLLEWQTAGFPSLLEMKIDKVKVGESVSEIQLKAQSGKKLKLLIVGDAQKLFPQVVARKADADAYRTEAYALLAAKFFTGPLATLAESKKLTLLTFAHVTALGTKIGSTTYKDDLYLVVDLGSDENVYNELRLNEAQRINRVMSDKLLRVLKAFAEPVRDVVAIHGLKLEFDIPHKSFTETSATSSLDKLELYVPAELIRKFAEADITSQQLLDGSVVIVNSNRVQVALSGS